MWFITSVKGIDSVHLHITESQRNSPLQHLLIDFFSQGTIQTKKNNLFRDQNFKSRGLFTHWNKTKCSTSCVFYVTSAPGLFEEVHPLYKTLFVCASPLCFHHDDALVCKWQGALIFITCKAVMGVCGWAAAAERCPRGLLMSARGWKLPRLTAAIATRSPGDH